MKASLAPARAEGRGALTEVEASALLAEYAIPLAASRLARTRGELDVALGSVAPPWVMKIVSPDIQHKTEVGGVMLEVGGREEVHQAFMDLRTRVAAARPDARIDGVVVQHRIEGVVGEVLLGVARDEQFGPVVLVGLGGVFAEALDDVALRVTPVDRNEATLMLRELKGVGILGGFRGRPAGDVGALEDTIVRLSRLALDLEEEIAEVDLNPVMVLPRGQGVIATDALVTLRAPRSA